ncbi:alpha/beta hydrolase [Taibaiella soli]|uniref:Alpha/beta hydrolase n=1 Tax=Taibaiella soli TaxID=1649169 RepID=A0A2W2AGZ9_9BACT|nr:alpha/beta hydrolase [Taibaiella soli]PZF74551.1 alpha/beta hydrolase [Taibaiella soli]
MNTFQWFFKGVRLAGSTWEPETIDRVIIIVHGIGEHMGRYDYLARHFIKQNYLVTGLDQYGHGNSEGKRGTTKGFDFYFDCLDAFIHYVKEEWGKPVVVYGHSMGGGILAGYLLKRQPQLLAAVLSAPALILASEPSLLLTKTVGVLSKLAPDYRISQGVDLNKISHLPEVVSSFKNDPLHFDKVSLQLAYEMVQNGKWCIGHANLLQIPTLLIHGDADEFTSIKGSDQFAANAPKQFISYKKWPGAFHELHAEPDRDEFLGFVEGWLSLMR